MGTIVFVHGTGVRLTNFMRALDSARKVAATAGITEEFVPCAWGDPLGVEFEGRSLPDPPTPEKREAEEADFATWNWLFDDPLFELDKLTIRAPPIDLNALPAPGVQPKWESLWDLIAAYRPSMELQLLLLRGGLESYWDGAWISVTQLSPIAHAAFEASASELPEASRALARAVIAQLHVDAVSSGTPGPSGTLRNSLFERLLVDWGQVVYGLSDFFSRIFERAATHVLRSHRSSFSDAASLPGGDVLMYQARGEEIRQFIRKKIESARPPVTLIAHSLGGIACVDLLALPDPPLVSGLVTVGSQAPLLYELGALYSLKPPAPLPQGFPRWLNFFDRNDFLSYIGHRLWPGVIDVETQSGQPFPASHSAYLGNDEVWRTIAQFIKQ